MLKLWNY